MYNINDAPGTVSLRSEKYEGMEVELNQYEAQKTERQLGVRLAMDGTYTEEYEHRLNQSKTLAALHSHALMLKLSIGNGGFLL